ncbi:hypothetical protein KXJ74_12770 [Acinetobacter johnsonii]|jgi:hypothetical protein|nr:hypothetical protein KXJ74_12770 [Acinetobacter johnsonii]
MPAITGCITIKINNSPIFHHKLLMNLTLNKAQRLRCALFIQPVMIDGKIDSPLKPTRLSIAHLKTNLSFFNQTIQYFKNNAFSSLTAFLKIPNIAITSQRPYRLEA